MCVCVCVCMRDMDILLNKNFQIAFFLLKTYKSVHNLTLVTLSQVYIKFTALYITFLYA